MGSFDNLVQFITQDEIEQDLSHDKVSWKWFSLYAQPKTGATWKTIFKDALSAVASITDGSSSLVSWVGSLGIAYDKSYKLKATAPYVETFVGTPTNPAQINITLNGNGWTWIGYPCQASNSLAAAFSEADPKNGDMVKGQSDFSIYNGSEWIGTLNAMEPGQGYMYYSKATTDKTFHYTKPTASGHLKGPRKAQEDFESDFCDNMTMIAVVMNGDELVEEAQVSVYAGTELRGLSTTPVVDGRHFLTIGGTGGQADVLTFVVTLDDQEYYLQQTETFQADALKGTLDEPYVLQMGEATNMAQLSNAQLKTLRVYDTNGLLVRSENHPTRLFTKDDLKSLPDGIYYQQVTLKNGQTYVLKMMR